MDDTLRTTLDAVRQLTRALRTGARRSEAASGLTSAELFIVRALGAKPAASLNELAERTYTDQSSASPVVERLRRRGLVRRARSSEDGRRVVIALTDTGSAVLAKAPEAPQDAVVGAFHRLRPMERRALARTLKRLVEEMGLSGGRPGMLFEDRAGDAPRRPTRRRSVGTS